MKKAKKRIVLIINVIGLLIMYLALIVAARNMIEQSYIAAIIIPVIITILLTYKHGILSVKKYLERLLTNRRFRLFIVFVIWLISVTIMVVITWNMRVDLSWDWGRLINCAATYVKEGTFDDTESFIGYPTRYFARCPNNITWEFFLILYFKVIIFFYPAASYDFYYTAAVCMSISFVSLSILISYEIARNIFHDEFFAFLCFIITVLSAPFYLYAQFAYTDTICLLLINFAVYTFVLFKQNNMTIAGRMALIICAISAGLLFKIKILGFIIVISVVLDLFGSSLRRDNLLVFFLSAVMFISVIVSLNIVSDRIIPISDSEKDKFEMPYTHFIMSGMNNYGGYSDDDVFFTMNAGNFIEKKEANCAEILRRMQEKGVLGTINHIFYVKQKRIWGNSCLAGDDYINRKPKTQSLLRDILGLNNQLHWLFLIYSWIVYYLILLGAFFDFFAAAFWCKNKTTFFIRLALVGVGMFLLIWECNSRYLFAYYSLILMIGMEGLNSLRGCVVKTKNAIK